MLQLVMFLIESLHQMTWNGKEIIAEEVIPIRMQLPQDAAEGVHAKTNMKRTMGRSSFQSLEKIESTE